jgi:hypothetical protein
LTTINAIDTERSRINDILQIALVEILGETQTQYLLDQNKETRISLTRLHQRLEEVYSNPSGKGIEHRVGQACFRYFLQRMGSEMGFFQSTFKLLPIKQKVLTGLNAMSGVGSRIFNEKIQFNEKDSSYQLQIGGKKPFDRPVGYYGCDFVVGFIKEFMAWVGNGKVYEVNEKECRSKGHDHCIYQISKVPLD